MSPVIIFALGSSLLAILYGGVTVWRLLKQDSGSARMKEISSAIAQGAKAYLNRQYKTIAVIAVVLAALLYFAFNATTAVGFLIGAILSALAGYIGMNVSVRANSRVAQAASIGMKPALALAFQGGAITG
ncbi:MAG: K(+)-insensitive pyrophosphate-energized proton pump, partial [Parcubacteria group bacterium GW2011_GWA2_47_64]